MFADYEFALQCQTYLTRALTLMREGQPWHDVQKTPPLLEVRDHLQNAVVTKYPELRERVAATLERAHQTFETLNTAWFTRNRLKQINALDTEEDIPGSTVHAPLVANFDQLFVETRAEPLLLDLVDGFYTTVSSGRQYLRENGAASQGGALMGGGGLNINPAYTPPPIPHGAYTSPTERLLNPTEQALERWRARAARIRELDRYDDLIEGMHALKLLPPEELERLNRTYLGNPTDIEDPEDMVWDEDSSSSFQN